MACPFSLRFPKLGWGRGRGGEGNQEWKASVKVDDGRTMEQHAHAMDVAHACHTPSTRAWGAEYVPDVVRECMAWEPQR